MKVYGKMTKLMVMVNTLTQMVQSMKDNGKMISNLEKELRDGLMGLAIRVHIFMARNMEKANLSGLIRVLTLAPSLIITLKEKVFMIGPMAESLLVTG